MRTLLLLISILATSTAHAQVVYRNDFESADVSGWTTAVSDPSYQGPVQASRPPNGSTRFLGEFGSQRVGFAMPGLPAHDSVVIEVDLYIIRSWDGNRTNTDGPDLMTIADATRGTLLRATFSNATGLHQSYPAGYPGGDNPEMTGATAVSSLGYAQGDAIYRLRFAYPHTASTLALSFEASLRDRFPTLANESWGLDNVRITAIPPRPAAATLVAGTVTGAPGERVFIPIYARNAVSLATSGATGIRTRMRFNASMLVPETPTPEGFIEGGDRVIDLTLPVHMAGDSSIALLNFRVAVGNDTVTAITLESSSAIGGSIALEERPGLFRTTGLCTDGGTRLFIDMPATLLRAPSPNPARTHTTIGYRLATPSNISLSLVDAGGRSTTRTEGMRDAGEHEERLELDGMAGGIYTILLVTDGEARSTPLVVVR